MADSRAGAGKVQMSTQHLFMPESKEALKSEIHQKEKVNLERLPPAKFGTV